MSKHNSGSYYVSKARESGLRVSSGKGSHVKIYAPADRGYMIVPMHRELANGTECAIKKWFFKLGIVLTIILGACWYLGWI